LVLWLAEAKALLKRTTWEMHEFEASTILESKVIVCFLRALGQWQRGCVGKAEGVWLASK